MAVSSVPSGLQPLRSIAVLQQPRKRLEQQWQILSPLRSQFVGGSFGDEAHYLTRLEAKPSLLVAPCKLVSACFRTTRISPRAGPVTMDLTAPTTEQQSLEQVKPGGAAPSELDTASLS